jgi:Tol biopolymer transport system component
MSTDRLVRIERTLPSLFDELADARTPAYLDAAIVTARVPSTRMPWRQLGVVALIAILVAAMLAAYIGSQRHLPPPYGLARNGVVSFVTPTGDLAIGDPRDGGHEIVVDEQRQVRAPSFSLDGTRLAYQRLDPDGVRVLVVDLERRQPVEVAKILDATDTLQWSPDGSRLTFLNRGQVWIARTDGSGSKALDLAMTADAEIEWRPPDGKELVVRGKRDEKAALFLLDVDGSNVRQITPMTSGEFDYLWLTWSPDGSRLAYSKAHPREVHVVDVDRGVDTLIQGDTGIGLMFPRWSPDGTRLAVMTWLREVPVQVRIGVIPTDDATPHVTLTGPTFGTGIQHDWAPDGTTILASEWGSSQPWLLEPGGGPGTRLDMSASFPDWVEWQRLAS